MIVVRITRVEDDGAETDLGDVRLVELGAVASHRSTPEGHAVVADIVGRLKADVLHAPGDCTCRYTIDGTRSAVLGCPAHRVMVTRAQAPRRRYDA